MVATVGNGVALPEQPEQRALDSVEKVLEANLLSRVAGKQLLAELPLQLTLRARLKSLLLLGIIFSCFWPTFWSVVAICVAYHGWNIGVDLWRQWQLSLTPSELMSRSSKGLPDSYPAAPAAAAPVINAVSTARPTAIVTGGKMTKALHVCRHLHSAGWRVVLLETTKYWHVGSRLSRSVDRFARVPIPELDPEAYKQAIADIANQEGAALFMPVSSPIASLYDAMAAEALPKDCRCWTLSPDMTALLDNKARFSEYADSLGLQMPAHHVVASPEYFKSLNNSKNLRANGKVWILKSLAYDSVHRADLFKLPCPPADLEAYLAQPDITITEQQPWLLQEFIKGKEYSCYSLAHEGRVVAHADTAAELSNLNYQHCAHPGIKQWVEKFVQASGVSGQLCFDFIESAADGKLYCIECNPRTSSVITEFHDNPNLVTAFTNPGNLSRMVEPLPASRPVYWWFNEVARLVKDPVGYLWRFLVVVSGGVDGVFDVTDPLPFLGLHFMQVPVLLLNNVIRGNPWTKVDLNIGKVAELYGD